jgi:hypothetical protein
LAFGWNILADWTVVSYKEQILDLVLNREEKVFQCQIRNYILT